MGRASRAGPLRRLLCPPRPLSIKLDIESESAPPGGQWGKERAGRRPGALRLRSAAGQVACVLLFGGGGGGKMAAHGGSAASSALKGLIQQFTAITGEARGNCRRARGRGLGPRYRSWGAPAPAPAAVSVSRRRAETGPDRGWQLGPLLSWPRSPGAESVPGPGR